MAGDRLEGHRADHDRPGIAVLGLDLVHALEGELEIEAAAAVEDRQRALARRLGQAVVAARGRNEQRGERIDDAAAMRSVSATRSGSGFGSEAESSVTLPPSMTSLTSSVSSSVVVRATNCGRLRPAVGHGAMGGKRAVAARQHAQHAAGAAAHRHGVLAIAEFDGGGAVPIGMRATEIV